MLLLWLAPARDAAEVEDVLAAADGTESQTA